MVKSLVYCKGCGLSDMERASKIIAPEGRTDGRTNLYWCYSGVVRLKIIKYQSRSSGHFDVTC